jgi:hypothetical protein
MTYNKWILDRLGLAHIRQIDLLITLYSDRNYATTYWKNDKQNLFLFYPKTINELILWLNENELILSEFDITLENNSHLQSFYGGDIIIKNLPQDFFDDLRNVYNYKFEDYILYQTNSCYNWQPVARNIHAIIDFLECNEDTILKMV